MTQIRLCLDVKIEKPYLLTSAVAAPEVRYVAVVEPGQGLLRVRRLVTKDQGQHSIICVSTAP